MSSLNAMRTHSNLYSNVFGPLEATDGQEPPTCPDCGRPRDLRRIVLFGKERQVWSENCGCWDKKHPKQEVNDKSRAAERVPYVYAEADFTWLPELREWVDAPGTGAIITGGPGTGKTWAACAALKAWASTGKGRAMFCRASEIIDAAHDAFSTHDKAATLARYKSPSLLVIDDLGKENPTDFAVELVFRAINERGDAGLPTIITTNYDANGLFKRLSSRSGDEVTAAAILSRLSQYRSFRMGGEDRRRA